MTYEASGGMGYFSEHARMDMCPNLAYVSTHRCRKAARGTAHHCDRRLRADVECFQHDHGNETQNSQQRQGHDAPAGRRHKINGLPLRIRIALCWHATAASAAVQLMRAKATNSVRNAAGRSQDAITMCSIGSQ